jgi:hypothetical protein
MTIKVNKEITNYKENFFNGLTKRATITLAIVAVCMVAGYAVNAIYVGGEYFQMAMMFVAVIAAFVGFYYKDGIWGGTYLFMLYRQLMLRKPLNCCEPYWFARSKNLAKNKKGEPTIRRVEISDELYNQAVEALRDPYAPAESVNVDPREIKNKNSLLKAEKTEPKKSVKQAADNKESKKKISLFKGSKTAGDKK